MGPASKGGVEVEPNHQTQKRVAFFSFSLSMSLKIWIRTKCYGFVRDYWYLVVTFKPEIRGPGMRCGDCNFYINRSILSFLLGALLPLLITVIEVPLIAQRHHALILRPAK
jgi:hypothetical protein